MLSPPLKEQKGHSEAEAAEKPSGTFEWALPPRLSLQVVTFDAAGVSGHSNHIALYKAVRYASLGDGREGFLHLLKSHSSVTKHSLPVNRLWSGRFKMI